jgi:hypothetical protein
VRTRNFHRVSLPGHGHQGWTVPPRNPRAPCHKNPSRPPPCSSPMAPPHSSTPPPLCF